MDDILTPKHHDGGLILNIANAEVILKSTETGVGDGIAVKNVEEEEDDQDGQTAHVDLANQGLLELRILLGTVLAQDLGHVVVSAVVDLFDFGNVGLCLVDRVDGLFHV